MASSMPLREGKAVYVLGELNVDLIMTGEDVAPQWNWEKLADGFDMVLGSSSAITACVLAGLGVPVRFVGVVGDDAFGRFCIGQLKNKGVDTAFVHVDEKLRTGVTLSLSGPQDRALLTYMGAIPHLVPEYVPNKIWEEAAHIHFGSYYLQKGMKGHWKELFSNAQRLGISTSFDVGWDPDETWDLERISELLAHTTLFIPSEEELCRIFGAASWREALIQMSGRGHGCVTAVKCGECGSALFQNGSLNEDEDRDESGYGARVFEAAAYDVTPVDTTGAGDSFNAGLIEGWLRGLRSEALLNWANACGALAVLRIGGASDIPTREQVLEFQRLYRFRE